MGEFSYLLLDNPRVINNNRIECCVIMNVAVPLERCILKSIRDNRGLPLTDNVIGEISICAG